MIIKECLYVCMFEPGLKIGTSKHFVELSLSLFLETVHSHLEDDMVQSHSMVVIVVEVVVIIVILVVVVVVKVDICSSGSSSGV